MSKLRLKKHEREELKQKYGGRCGYCGVELGDKWHADHMTPVFRYSNGEMHHAQHDTMDNLLPACHPCNLHKHCADLENYRRIIDDGRREFLRSGKGKALVRMGMVQMKADPVVFYFERLNRGES